MAREDRLEPLPASPAQVLPFPFSASSEVISQLPTVLPSPHTLPQYFPAPVLFQLLPCRPPLSPILSCPILSPLFAPHHLHPTYPAAQPLAQSPEGSPVSAQSVFGRVLCSQHLGGICTGQTPYGLTYDTLSLYPEPWF